MYCDKQYSEKQVLTRCDILLFSIRKEGRAIAGVLVF